MQEITSLSIKKLVESVKDKKISCVEIMQAYLNRIAKVNPHINAIVEFIGAEQALNEARGLDEHYAKTQSLGKLQGIPITIKQGRKVKGLPCNLGTHSPMNFVAKEDATVVARLRAAGAIVVGVTNIPDFSMSYETDSTLYGCTHNPYNLSCSPGGSSGGEAAIIACGGSAFGIGADSGGSIRQPAHNCGIAGLKPTRGRVPSTGQFPEDGLGIFSYIETQGPLARYIEDIIYAFPILIGPDGHDANIYPAGFDCHAKSSLDTLHGKFYTANGVTSPSIEIDTTIRQVLKTLSTKIGSLKEACPSITRETFTEFEELFFYGGDRGQWLLDRMQKMQVTKVRAPFQAILERAKLCEFSVTELRRRLLEVDKFKFKMMDFIEDTDVIICPVATNTAGFYNSVATIKIPTETKLALAYDLTYNLPYNIMGWPAVAVRCGTSKEGLPIGLQIIAKPWRDDVALAVAKAIEEISGGWQMPNFNGLT